MSVRSHSKSSFLFMRGFSKRSCSYSNDSFEVLEIAKSHSRYYSSFPITLKPNQGGVNF